MTGLQGQFRIVCSARPGGESFLSEQRVESPFHLGKGHWDGQVLLVHCVNATAGVFAGDELSLDVRVEPGARLLLASPSAHRIHTMPDGCARMAQRFRVARGAWLEVMPELFIPQRGCRYGQQTRVEVEEGGGAFFVETLAPGRTAHGEQFAFARVDWETEVYHGGCRLLRERYALQPGDDSLWALRCWHDPAYFASCAVVSSRLKADVSWQAALDAMPTEDALLAGGLLTDDFLLVRILARHSPALREACHALRQTLAAWLPGLRASARKV